MGKFLHGFLPSLHWRIVWNGVVLFPFPSLWRAAFCMARWPNLPVGRCVEVWNPHSNTMRGARHSRVPRFMGMAVGCNDRLYFVGGIDHVFCGAMVTHCEVYDSSSCTWDLIQPMPRSVHQAGIHAGGSKFYVFGGAQMFYDGSTSTDFVQVFDTVTNRWTREVSNLC